MATLMNSSNGFIRLEDEDFDSMMAVLQISEISRLKQQDGVLRSELSGIITKFFEPRSLKSEALKSLIGVIYDTNGQNIVKGLSFLGFLTDEKSSADFQKACDKLLLRERGSAEPPHCIKEIANGILNNSPELRELFEVAHRHAVFNQSVKEKSVEGIISTVQEALS